MLTPTPSLWQQPIRPCASSNFCELSPWKNEQKSHLLWDDEITWEHSGNRRASQKTLIQLVKAKNVGWTWRVQIWNVTLFSQRGGKRSESQIWLLDGWGQKSCFTSCRTPEDDGDVNMRDSQGPAESHTVTPECAGKLWKPTMVSHKSLCLWAVCDGYSPWAAPCLTWSLRQRCSDVWSAVTTSSFSDQAEGQGRKTEPGHRTMSHEQLLASNLAGPGVAPLLVPEKHC